MQQERKESETGGARWMQPSRDWSSDLFDSNAILVPRYLVATFSFLFAHGDPTPGSSAPKPLPPPSLNTHISRLPIMQGTGENKQSEENENLTYFMHSVEMHEIDYV